MNVTDRHRQNYYGNTALCTTLCTIMHCALKSPTATSAINTPHPPVATTTGGIHLMRRESLDIGRL